MIVSLRRSCRLTAAIFAVVLMIGVGFARDAEACRIGDAVRSVVHHLPKPDFARVFGSGWSESWRAGHGRRPDFGRVFSWWED